MKAQLQNLLDTFFALIDSESDDGAQAFSELFTKDGCFVSGKMQFHGREALKNNRLEFWKHWPGMKHTAKRAYQGYEDELDVMVIVNAEIERPDGTLQSVDSAANFKAVQCADNTVLLQRVELFTDPTPLMQIMRNV